MQVLRQGKRKFALADAQAIDLQILKHALDVIPGLVERDLLDPIDSIDAGEPWIAELTDPLRDP